MMLSKSPLSFSDKRWSEAGHLTTSLFVLLATILYQVTLKPQSTHLLNLSYGLLVVFFVVQLFVGSLKLVIHRKAIWDYSILVIDTLLISLWLASSNIENSFVVFLYPVVILLAALTFFSRGGLALAMVSSLCFGAVMFWDRSIEKESLLSWMVYSGVFLAVGLVGGYLSSELVKASERLRQKNSEIQKLTLLFERIINGMPTGLLIVDDNLNLAFMNPGAEAILGKQQEDVLDKNLATVEPDLLPFFQKIDSKRIVDESDDQKGAGMETELAATGTEWHRSVFLSAKLTKGNARLQQTVELGNGKNKRLLRGDVAEVEMSSHTGEILGRVEGVGRVLLFQDVTKLVHLEDKLKQNEKLAAVGQLAAGIAHEIRNPLASMSGSVQMLQEGSETSQLSTEDQKLMSIIKKEIDRLNGLVNEFLTFVKPDQFELKTVDLQTLLSDIAIQALNRKNESAGVEIIQQLHPGIRAQGNQEKLTQVAWNLLTNALQAMRGPGKVSIGCGEVSPHWVCFWIEDEGEGMTDDTLQHLYEPFFTTKPKGTGLGLATVYKIVEAHQGEIRVRSKKGEGTRFEVHLPKA